jgi:hypothetical protein
VSPSVPTKNDSHAFDSLEIVSSLAVTDFKDDSSKVLVTSSSLLLAISLQISDADFLLDRSDFQISFGKSIAPISQSLMDFLRISLAGVSCHVTLFTIVTLRL